MNNPNREQLVEELRSAIAEREPVPAEVELQWLEDKEVSENTDQTIDSEFEEELARFKRELPSQRQSCKLIPNVSASWIASLKRKITNSSYCMSFKKAKLIPCATTSTAGMSLNSPPATERTHGYEEVEEVRKGSFMNI